MSPDADFWSRALRLERHPEGGEFRETWRAAERATGLPDRFEGPRVLGTAILYLLRAGERSRFHRLRADEAWHFHEGGPLHLHVLVPGAGGLVAVDAAGGLLPFDPARAAAGGGLDLPLAQVADSGVVQVLARIQALDPALFQDIDAARRYGGKRGDVLLELGSHRVLVARDAGPEVVQAVVLVARDLAAKARPYAELDARYAGQVVVRRKASA